MDEKNFNIMNIIDKFSIEICKHEAIYEIPNLKLCGDRLLERNNACNAIAKELGFPNMGTVKYHIKRAQCIALNKMRRYVRVSFKQGNSGYDALKLAPTWIVRLNKPFGLIEKAVKMETVTKFKDNNYPAYIKWELLHSAQMAAEQADGSMQAASVLMESEAIKNFSLAEQLDAAGWHKLYSIWFRFYSNSIHKLMALIEVGDFSHKVSSQERLTVQEWRAADLALLYDIRVRVLRDDVFTCYITLKPLIVLFKLMAEVKKFLDTNKSIEALTGDQRRAISLFQSGHPTRSTENVECGSKLCEQISDGNGEDTKSMDTYETAEIWALVYSEYKKHGYMSSAVLLQKRWYELKQLSRMRVLAARRAPLEPAPLLLALAKRFPYTLTEKLPSWTTLVKSKRIYTDADLMPFRVKSTDQNPVLKCYEMNEDATFDELYSSDDDIEIIDQKKETITVYDSDDEETKLNSAKQKAADSIENYNTFNVNSSCIETLENLDPTKAKVEVIFDDDSDSDNYDINNLNDDIKNVIKSNPTFNTSLTESTKENANIRSRLNFEESNLITKVKNEELNELGSIEEDELKSTIGTDFMTNFERSRNFISNTNEISKGMELFNVYVKVESISSSEDDEADDESDKKRTVIDDKLVKLTHVVLTPVEHLCQWKIFARDGTINCRRFSVKLFSKPIAVNSDQLSKCRPFLRRQEKGIKPSKIPEYIRRKRKILTRYLRLPRTYFSASFWNDRNVKLLEMCKPVSVRVKKGLRTVKKVELSDISEVRRINKTILTAQVAPIIVGQNHTLVINSNHTDSNTQMDTMEPSEPTKVTDDTPALSSSNTQEQTNLPALTLKLVIGLDKHNYPVVKQSPLNTNLDIPQENSEENNISHDSNKEMISADMQKLIKENVNSEDEILNEMNNKQKKNPSEDKMISHLSPDNGLSEWNRQKTQNLQYFNLEPSKYTEKENKTITKNIRKEKDNNNSEKDVNNSEKDVNNSEKDDNNSEKDNYNSEKDDNNSEKDSLKTNEELSCNDITTEENPLIINETETDIVNKNALTDKVPLENLESNDKVRDFNHGSDEKMEPADVNNLIKQIVMRCRPPKLKEKPFTVSKMDNQFLTKQQELENDINTMVKYLFKNSEDKELKKPVKIRKKKPTKDKQSPSFPNAVYGAYEWNRQKTENLQYFNLTPISSKPPKSSEKKNKKRNKKKTKEKQNKTHEINNDKDDKNSICYSKKPNVVENNGINEIKVNPLNFSENTQIINPKTFNIDKILDRVEKDKHLKSLTDYNKAYNIQNNAIVEIKENPLNNCEYTETEIVNPKKINIRILHQGQKDENLKHTIDSHKINIQNNGILQENLNICENTRMETLNPKTIDIDKILDEVDKNKLQKPLTYSSPIDNFIAKNTQTQDQNDKDVIDLCDSNDEDDAIANVKPVIVSNVKQTGNDETVKPQINIRIVKNMIEINGEGDTEALKEKSDEILTLLSKVAGKIKKNKTAQQITAQNNQSGNNPTVYYVVKTLDNSMNNSINLETDVHTGEQNNEEKSIGPNSKYHVLMLAGDNSAYTAATNPLPDHCFQMPIIQSVTSLANQEISTKDMNKIVDPSSKTTDIANDLSVPIERRNATAPNAVKIEDIDSNTLLAPMKRRNSELMPINSVWSAKRSRNSSIDDNQIYPIVVSSAPSRMMQERILIGNINSDSNKNHFDTELYGRTRSNSINVVSPKPGTSSQKKNT